MSLRIRVLLSIGLTLAILVTGIATLSSRFTLASFARLERENALENVTRAARTVDRMVNDVYVKSADWSTWDDAYRFMRDGNAAFVKSNLAKGSLENIHVDAILFVTPEGRYFRGMTLPHPDGTPASRPDDLLAAIDLARRGRDAKGIARDFSGLVPLPQGTMMVSVRPVLPTDSKGVARGWVVFGRYFGKGEVGILRDLTRLDADVRDLQRPDVSAGPPADDLTAIVVRTLDERTIVGRTVLPDLDGRPDLMLTMREPRTIFQQGLRSVADLRDMIVGAGIAFGLVVIFVLERFAFGRLSRLSEDVAMADRNGSVRVEGRDELGALGRKINEMLGRIHEAEGRLQGYNADLERTVHERTREIEHQAFHDKLTGLANRALFVDRVGLALAKARRTSLGTAAFFVDLDNFKRVNDSLGHGAGDDLLVGVAARLQEAVRPGDTVARLGGDEFTVLLEDLADGTETEEVAARIQAALRTPFVLDGHEIFVGGSVGIAYTPDESMSADALLENADMAMYRAKVGGKGGVVVYDERMRDHVAERLDLETGLRKALDQGELKVLYQPLIDLDTAISTGAEALVRWMHPTRGMMPPSEFVPIAEETGLIVPIGYWVLEEACLQALRWREDVPGFTMGVNLSGRQIQRPDVVERVAGILERTGLPPSGLKLEITETILMTDVEDVVAKLVGLKVLGVGLALDDFGTGYSSLATLSAFPIDTLKIDQAFVGRLGEGADEATSIVEAIMALSRGMNMDVIGEGVENEAQRKIIHALGCRTGQGYLFDRPLSVEDFEIRLRAESLPMAA